MARLLLRRGLLLAVLAGAALFGAAVSGCGGSSSDRAQTTGAIAAVSSFDSSGFHEIDEQLTGKGTLDPTAHSVAVHIQSVALATDWPKDLQAGAKSLAQAMGDFAKAIDTDNPDIKQATQLSNKAHAAWHAFSTQVWDYLAKKTGVKAGGGSAVH